MSRRRHNVRASDHTHTFIQFSLLLFSDSSRLIVMVIRLAICCSLQTAIRSLDFSRKAHLKQSWARTLTPTAESESQSLSIHFNLKKLLKLICF